MHCITATLLRKEDLKDHLESIPHQELSSGIISIPGTYRFFLEQNSIKHINIKTDYFGGSGEQTCELFDTSLFNELIKCESINYGLKKLGVIKESDMDEFDTVGLGLFRSNSDFTFKKNSILDENLRMTFCEWVIKLQKK